MSLASLDDLVNSAIEFCVVEAVVVEVHELKQTQALLWVLVQHQFDDVLAHLRDGDVRWEAQARLSYLRLRLRFILAPEG